MQSNSARERASMGGVPTPSFLAPNQASVHYRRYPTAPTDHQMMEHQKIIDACKNLKKPKSLDYMEIPWYHPNISRHVAESLLSSRSTPDGTYLLRKSTASNSTLTLSVSCQKVIKHYRVTWDGKTLCFGLGRFKTISEFLDHFESQPIISGDSGVIVNLKYPYPRKVKEHIQYEEAVFSEPIDDITDPEILASLNITQKPPSTHGDQSVPSRFTINARDGYLTKQGQHRKNWKLRWFRLFQNSLAYYPNEEASTPLRVIDLRTATEVKKTPVEVIGKENCFQVVTPNRTFYMYSSSVSETNSWVALIRSKVKALQGASTQDK